MDTDILIIGGGVSGLYAAYQLERAGIDYQLCEARGRLGGRILTEPFPEPATGAGFDLGPSWIWPDFQPHIARLLPELGLTAFEQYHTGDMLFEAATGNEINRLSESSPMQGSYRIAGGTQSLINALEARIPEHRIHLDTQVTALMLQDGAVKVKGNADGPFSLAAKQCIICIPPRLLARTMTFSPSLAETLTQQLLRTATWMAGHAKVIAVYETPFWRADGLSGGGFSQRGPLTEIHDASPANGGPYALFGFVGYPPKARASMGEVALLKAVQEQLERMYGPFAAKPVKLLIKDWSQDPLTATQDDMTSLHQHPEYGFANVADTDSWSGFIHFAGTEMAEQQGGYIEGAFVAVDKVLGSIL